MTQPVKQPRQYDATRRRERAAESRRATRAAVLEAAEALFTANGYVATSVTAIAEAAGVSAQTVYANFETKRGIIQQLMEQRVRAGGPAPPFRPPPGESDPKDPRELLRTIAAGGRRLFERVSPIWPVAREAAASDPVVAAWWYEAMERRYRTAETLIARLPPAALKPGLTPRTATDVFWTVASPESYDALVRRRGWSAEAFETWIAAALADLLLA